jgi:multidrug efflux pump subunit AcrA (membrane-fusion protein)
VQLATLSLSQAEEALRAIEKSAPLDAEAAQRANRIVQEDVKQFFEVERPFLLKTAEMMVEVANQRVEYEEEELRQLEKMYKSDEATAETEKIVLKRARDSVKVAKFMLEETKLKIDNALKVELPRQDQKAKEAAQRSEIGLNLAKISVPVALGKQRLEMEKLRVEHKQAAEHLRKLREDRALMNVKSPADGIIYYGKCSRGKWSGSGSEPLHRGNSISSGEVFMTLVQARPLLVRVSVPESEIQHVHGGLQAVVEPTAYSGVRLPAIVQRVGTVPMTAGSFDGELTVALDGKAEGVMPGMACEVKMVPYKKLDALTVSPKAVFGDDFDAEHQYVYVATKTDKGKPEKRAVTVGKRNDKQVEILSGLQEGDEVLAERPKDDQ